MKTNYFVIFGLFVFGLIILMMSLYTASLSGVMNKMGLVGGDLRQSINFNELARRLRGLDNRADCGVWHVTKNVPSYLFAKGQDKVRLAIELGGERIVCGIMYTQDGNVERGIYTLVKGVNYLTRYFEQTRIALEGNTAKCSDLKQMHYAEWVEAYLMASDGRAHDVVYEAYKQMELSRARVEEICVD